MTRPSRKSQGLWGLVLVATIAFCAVATNASGQRDRQDQKSRQAGGALTAPTDPDAIAGTWTIGGQERSITKGEFFRYHQTLTKLMGSTAQGVTPQKVWEHLLIAQEADAMGLVVLDEDVDAIMGKDEPEIFAGVLAQWEQIGVSEADGRRFFEDTARIQALKDFYLNNSRTTTREVFDVFKVSHLQYQLEYLLFDAQPRESGVDRSKISDDELKAFWTRTPQVRNEFRTQASVSAEMLWFDTTGTSLADVQNLVAGRRISREEALAYFNAHRDALMREIPPESQHKLVISDETPLDEIVTPFEVLEDTIKKKMLLSDHVNSAFTAASSDPTIDLAALANKHGLGYTKVDAITRRDSIKDLTRFGFNSFNTLSNATVGQLPPAMLNERGLQWFYRVNEKKPARLPEVSEIRDQLVERYVQMDAVTATRAEAKAALDWMVERVTKELQPLEAQFEKEADVLADERIQQRGLTNPQDIERERRRAHATTRQKLEIEKRKVMPKHLDAWCKETGRELSLTPHFEFKPMRTERKGMSDTAASRQLFLATNYYIRSLQPGDVTTVLLEDPLTRCFFIARLKERKDPSFELMGPVDYVQARAQVRQRVENQFVYRWRYAAVARRLSLQVKN